MCTWTLEHSDSQRNKKTGRLPTLGTLWEQMRGQDRDLRCQGPSHRCGAQSLRAGPRPRASSTKQAELRYPTTALDHSSGIYPSGNSGWGQHVGKGEQPHCCPDPLSALPPQLSNPGKWELLTPFIDDKAEAQEAKELILFPS